MEGGVHAHKRTERTYRVPVLQGDKGDKLPFRVLVRLGRGAVAVSETLIYERGQCHHVQQPSLRDDLEYTAVLAGDAAILAQAVGSGPVQVTAQHILVEALGLTAPFAEVNQLLVNWFVLQCSEFDATLSVGSCHFLIRLSRFATLLLQRLGATVVCTLHAICGAY